jgi:RNA polymerase sigma-70 factor (ECF subfamily)
VDPAAELDPPTRHALAFRDGQGEAFPRLVEAARRGLHALCLRLLGDPDDAADAVQETFVRAHDALIRRRFEPRSGGAEAWLRTIATRFCLNALRARRVRHVLGLRAARESVDVLEGSARLDARAALRRLDAHLERLPPRQRVVFLLRLVEGATSAKVALTLGISEGAVEQALVRAWAALRERDQR